MSRYRDFAKRSSSSNYELRISTPSIAKCKIKVHYHIANKTVRVPPNRWFSSLSPPRKYPLSTGPLSFTLTPEGRPQTFDSLNPLLDLPNGIGGRNSHVERCAHEGVDLYFHVGFVETVRKPILGHFK